METVRLRVEHGAFLECPVWEDHRRGRNWWAEISADPRSPGGLARRFWERARGQYCYILPQGLTPPVAVEIGADYYTCRGRRLANRWYGVVTQVAPDSLTLVRCKGPREAIALADQLRRPADLHRVVLVPRSEPEQKVGTAT